MNNSNLPNIYIGGDHASYKIRESLEKHLYNSGYIVFNLGCHSTAPANYATYSLKVATKVHENPNSLGIVICGSGIGVNIAANKVKGIKSSLVFTNNMAEKARINKSNIIALGSRFLNENQIIKFVDTFLQNKTFNEVKSIDEQYMDIDFTKKVDFSGTNNHNDSTDKLTQKTAELEDLSTDDIQNSKIMN